MIVIKNRYYKQLGHTGQFNRQQATGNPMEDSYVQEYCRGARKILRSNHVIKSSLPMSYHDMNKITKWLNSDINDYSKNEIIMLDCFLSITWTCMLRIEEATNITFHDIEWDLNHQLTPFTKIYISNRKTDIGKGLIFED